MMSDRLLELAEHLELLYEQRKSLEQEAVLTTTIHKTQAQQRLRKQIKPQIDEYEQEYQQILDAASEQLTISDPEAETIVGEIVTGVNQIELQSPDIYSSEVMAILWEIREILKKPGEPAAVRLKGVISTMPPFFWITLDTELDGEKFCQRHFPTFTRLVTPLIKSAAKK